MNMLKRFHSQDLSNSNYEYQHCHHNFQLTSLEIIFYQKLVDKILKF